MRFVTYNIRYALGQDGRNDLARVVRAVDGADVIALQEVERFWPRSGMADQPAEIGAMLPDYYWIFGPAFDVDASERREDGPLLNRRRQFGPMLLSKSPILSSRLHVFPKIGIGAEFNMDTGALEGVLANGSGPLRVYSLHLSSLSVADRLLQLDRLSTVLDHAAEDGGAWSGAPLSYGDDWSCGEPPPPMPDTAILLGDFNAEPDSEEYRRLTQAATGLVGGGTGQRFTDAWVAAGHCVKEVFTWSPYPGAVPAREMRLDYGFVTADLSGRVKDAWVDHTAVGSDHYPCWFDIEPL